ncbi:bacterial low temperature requirement A protein-domain-containing protein [Microdochium trichocladiopsis]|uniref:Bacterial low temperature requirement A protein-domain-containing protein n=1 Tax=Microdochium trichocladiopsis TaxID=1682393 RepID=A0A9P9BVP6_9PEZI|nr:bacterial low temperature requirement A protein-domain-containing protein [Microdochium trichocladiopsis]KAH7040498.1 bacterial low temperature requirement A protein-domain-containing protein [Microdochium trichocladiopsis]
MSAAVGPAADSEQPSLLLSSSASSATTRTPSRRPSRAAAASTMGAGSTTTEFHVPPGKKILVALPEDAARLRAKYKGAAGATTTRADRHSNGENEDGDDKDIQIEIVVHGSSEHSAHLHSARRHHEARREEFARRFGADFDEWESTQSALDEVNRQLEGLVEHEAPSALSANFDRFGYSATLKTYAVHPGRESTPGSSRASLNGSDSDSGTLRNWDDTSGGRTIRLFQRPVIKQYFHKGLLWRNSEQTEVMSFELFFELIYVGIIHYNGEHVADKTDALEIGRFIITFVMSWQVWSDVQQGISWFQADDVVQRVYILFIIACLLGFTTNMTGTFNAEYDTYTQLVGFYVAARLATALFYSVSIVLLPLIKGFMLSQVILIVIPSMIWIGSIFVDLPSRFALIAIAWLLDYSGPSVLLYLFAWTRPSEKPRSKRMAKFYDFWPAINIEHRVERTNAFVALVIGWAVVALLYQNAAFGFNAILGKAIIGLVQAFVFNWIYFEVDGENLHLHAIRRSGWSSALWSIAHLPFICAYTLSSAAMSKIVVAHDSINSDPHSLEEYYAHNSKPYVTQGVRWAYCVGLAIALLHMGLISMSHVHKVPPGMRVPKKYRMLNRGVVCVIFFCLPLAGDALDSLRLVAVTMLLMVWVLLLEIWGKSCSDQTWCGNGLKAGQCRARYEARCSKKTLEKALMQEKEDAAGDDAESGRLGDVHAEAQEKSERRRDKNGDEPEIEVLQLSRKEKTAVA